MAVIFVSRGTMSGVHLLMDCLHERTGIRCLSREDLEEVVNLPDRILVIHEGKIVREFSGEKVDEEELVDSYYG